MAAGLFPLRVTGACLGRRGKTRLGPIDLEIAAVSAGGRGGGSAGGSAGVSIVLGPNGSGKTSLLRMLHGIERLSAGQIRWGCALDEARRRQAFVFQAPVILRRSLRDNIAYPLLLAGVAQHEARARAEVWAGRIGLGDKAHRDAAELSGGERQKLALARALIAEPDLLFLDEPCAALDGRATRDIEALLQEAVAAGTRLLMATHDMGQARRLASDVLFVLHGKLHEQSPADVFFNGPRTPEAAAFLRGDIVE